MNEMLIAIIVYISIGILLSLLITYMFKNEDVLKQIGTFDRADIEGYHKLKKRYDSSNMMTFAILVVITPMLFAYDVVKMLLSGIVFVYNSISKMLKNLVKGKK